MRGLVAAPDLEAAWTGSAGKAAGSAENLIALGFMTTEQLYGVIEDTPVMPRNIAETGLSRGMLLGLVLKFMRMQSCETLPELSQRLHLSHAVIQEILDEATTPETGACPGSGQHRHRPLYPLRAQRSTAAMLRARRWNRLNIWVRHR